MKIPLSSLKSPLFNNEISSSLFFLEIFLSKSKVVIFLNPRSLKKFKVEFDLKFGVITFIFLFILLNVSGCK